MQSPLGSPPPVDRLRFVISIALAQAGNPPGVLIHDTVTAGDCLPPEKDQSRFGDFEWALERGYQPCPQCMGNDARLPGVPAR